jgi:hypothetical protein
MVGREAAFARNADTRIRSRWLGAMLAGEHALASINARAADAGFQFTVTTRTPLHSTKLPLRV